jgi:hypothetical protein
MLKLAGKNATAACLLWGMLLLYVLARFLELYSGAVPILTLRATFLWFAAILFRATWRPKYHLRACLVGR